MIRNRLSLKIIIALFMGLAFVCLAILGISYRVVNKFTNAGDIIIYGKRQSELTKNIRDELLQRKDIKVHAFATDDGFTLTGFLFERENAQANLLLCHGYRGGKEFMYGYIDMFPKYNIFMFDFRAHGQSSGDFTSLGCHEYKDVIAASKFFKQSLAKNKQDTLPMIALGISMGGASCLKASETAPNLADVFIIDSTYSELKTMFLRGFSLKVGLPYYPFFSIIQTMFHYMVNCDMRNMAPVECVKKLRKPVYFIASCSDNFITPDNSLRLYSAALSPKTKLWIGPKCRHGWLHTYHQDIYKRKMKKFLAQTIFEERNNDTPS